MITNLLRVAGKRMKRLPMHAAIRPLASWEPLRRPDDGFSVVVACMRSLAPLATANLRLIERAAGPDLKEVILVFDCTESRIPEAVRRRQNEWDHPASLRVLGYSPDQERVTARISWGWVYAWLSWSLGIACARTRHVLLHDLDALPLDQGLFQNLYSRALASAACFQGIRTYSGNGVEASMNLATTFEMVIDAAYVRSHFVPFDAFNHASVIEGRYVDFDTMLYMQYRARNSVVETIDESRLVHPSQLICQFTDFMAGRDPMRGRSHNLPMLAYYYHLGDESHDLQVIGEALSDPDADEIPFHERRLPVDGIPPAHWAWMEKQVRRVEQRLHGRTRPEVEHYLTGIVERAGEHRTVGREGAAGVAAI